MNDNEQVAREVVEERMDKITFALKVFCVILVTLSACFAGASVYAVYLLIKVLEKMA